MSSTSPYSMDAEDRLHSWKAIASFLGCGVRTVQRWELERGLPIHRTPGGKSGSVYALKQELVEWLTRTDAAALAEADALGLSSGLLASDPPALSTATVWENSLEKAPHPLPEAAAATIPSVAPVSPEPRWWQRRRLALAFAAGLCAVLLVLPLKHRLVRARSSSTPAARMAHVPDAAAVDLYLQGRYYWEKRDAADLQRALDLFTQAIVRDPSYAEAYAGLADCYNLLREYSTMDPQEAYPRAIAAATRAIQLDDSSAQAHLSLAFGTFYWSWEPQTADYEFERAIQLRPDLAVAHQWYANTLALRHRTQEAMREIDSAQRLDPSSTAILDSKGLILLIAGNDHEGVALLRQLESVQPDYLSPHSYLASYYLAHGNAPDYVVEQRAVANISHDPLDRKLADAAERGFASGGSTAMMRSMLEVLNNPPAHSIPDYWLAAQLNAQLNQPDESLISLRLAYAARDPRFYGLRFESAFARLHGTPEFEQMAALIYHSVQQPTSAQAVLRPLTPGAETSKPE